MDRGGWKFWCRRHERLLCYIVAADDRAEAEKALRNHDAFAEVLDVERVPDKVFALLDMRPGQVTGWSTMSW